MKETIELLAGLGFTADAIKEILAGAKNVSVNVFEGNNNVVVIGGNYFESGSKGNPSRKSKKAPQDNSLESAEEQMGEAEPEPEQPPNERDRDTSPPPPEQPPVGPDPDLVQQVRDHLATLQVELDGVDLDSFTEDGLRQVLAAQGMDAAEGALVDNEPIPFD